MSAYNRTIEDIAETLKNAKDRGDHCSLLVGAGCSVEAGIPSAQGFVEQIKQKHPLAYQRAIIKSYPACMAQLTSSERRALIADYVDKAKINWAHIGMARLIQENFVDRVLTTNFDPLIVQACALLGEFPAVYDFASSQLFNAGEVADKAIFHLHGQRTGFVIMNTEDECNKHSGYMAPIFEDAGRRRLWIVVGYSGDNDPVFQHLASVRHFASGLYWVGFQDQEPPIHVRDKLLMGDKDAFFVSGHDADSFFVRLTQQLGLFPPELVQKPFAYLDGLISKISDFRIPDQNPTLNVLAQAQGWVKTAREEYETPSRDGRSKEDLVSETTRLLMAGKYDAIIKLDQRLGKRPRASGKYQENLEWAYVMLGVQALKSARLAEEESNFIEVEKFTIEAGDKYKSALVLNPNNFAALLNWGISLVQLAPSVDKNKREGLYRSAIAKYKTAFKVKPKDTSLLICWAAALAGLAKTLDGASSGKMFVEAFKKFKAAAKIKSDQYSVFNNWGAALADCAAVQKNQHESQALYLEAFEKFGYARKLNNTSTAVLNNWGRALGAYAVTQKTDKADSLYKEAFEKFAASVSIKADNMEALNSWGLALVAYAENKKISIAEGLYREAFKKFESVIKFQPKDAAVFCNWGIALAKASRRSGWPSSDVTSATAFEKFNKAVEIRSDSKYLCNWGVALAELSELRQGEEACALLKKACEKFELATAISPDNANALGGWAGALVDCSQFLPDDEVVECLEKALGKYEEALQKPDSNHVMIFNGCGNAFRFLASAKKDSSIYLTAIEKFKAVLVLDPEHAGAINNLGIAFAEYAETQEISIARGYYKDAQERFRDVLKLDPEHIAALDNWALALSEQAAMESAHVAEHLYVEVAEKYERAVKIEPSAARFYLWAVALMRRGRILNNEFSSDLFDLAEVKFLESIKYDNGLSSYDLACLYALKGDKAKCKKWILKARALNNLPQVSDFESDEDLIVIRNDKWFKKLIAEMR